MFLNIQREIEGNRAPLANHSIPRPDGILAPINVRPANKIYQRSNEKEKDVNIANNITSALRISTARIGAKNTI